MKTIQFDNLVEGNPKNKNFGKNIEIEVPDDFDEQVSKKARFLGGEFGARIAAINTVASESGKKIREAFGDVKTRNN